MRLKHFKDLVQWQRVSGQPLSMNDLTLTPQSRVLIIRLPGSAFIWQRPTAMVIERNGQEKSFPIVDLTRTIQLGLCGLGVAIIIARFVQISRRKEKAL